MKAIETKYFGPGNVRGSRIKASDGDTSLFLPYDDGLSEDDNHIEAAKTFAKERGWSGVFVTGGLKRSYVHVFIASRPHKDLIFSDIWRTGSDAKTRFDVRLLECGTVESEVAK